MMNQEPQSPAPPQGWSPMNQPQQQMGQAPYFNDYQQQQLPVATAIVPQQQRQLFPSLPPRTSFSDGTGNDLKTAFEGVLESTDDSNDVFSQWTEISRKPWRLFALFVLVLVCLGVGGLGLIFTLDLFMTVYFIAIGLIGTTIVMYYIIKAIYKRRLTVDKRARVLYFSNHYRLYDLFKCFMPGSNCYFEPLEMRLDEVDYITVSGAADGFFDDYDFVEDLADDGDEGCCCEVCGTACCGVAPTCDGQETYCSSARRFASCIKCESVQPFNKVPVKVARRKLWEQQLHRSGNSNGVQMSSGQQNNTNEVEIEGSDAWLRQNKFYRPRHAGTGGVWMNKNTSKDFDDEQEVQIVVVRRNAHSYVPPNPEKVKDSHQKERIERIIKGRAIVLESVPPSQALDRIADWEAYFAQLQLASNRRQNQQGQQEAVVTIRRSLPFTPMFCQEARYKSSETADEIKTDVSLKNGKTERLMNLLLNFLIVLEMAMLAYFVVDSVVYSTNDESSESQNLKLALVMTLLGVVLLATLWTVLFSTWWYTRKMILSVDKVNRKFNYRLFKKLTDNHLCASCCNADGVNDGCCCCDCCDVDPEETGEPQVAALRFDDVHSIQVTHQEGDWGRGGQSDIKLFFYSSSPGNDGDRGIKKIVIASVASQCANQELRTWKKYFVDDLGIRLNHQPEDEAFVAEAAAGAAIQNNNNNNNNNHEHLYRDQNGATM